MSDPINVTNEQKRKFTSEDIKFMISQAEMKISNLTDEANLHYNRSLIFIGICIPLLTGAGGYIMSNYKTVPLSNTISLIVIIIALYCICTILKGNVFPKVFYTTGCTPKQMLDKVFYTDIEESKDSNFEMLWWILNDANDKINQDSNLNKDRAKNLKNAVTLLYVCPVVAFVTFLITRLWSGCPCLV